MKALFLVLSLCAGPFSIQAVQAEAMLQALNSSQLVTFNMQNMGCAMCEFTIKKALHAVDGVQEVDVDYESKTTAVTFDPQKTNTEIIIEATTNAGYPATVRQPR